MLVTAARWVSWTSFGSPVVPLEDRSRATSPGSASAAGEPELLRGLALGEERADRRDGGAGAQRAEQLDDELGAVGPPDRDDRLAGRRPLGALGELAVGHTRSRDQGWAIGEADGVAQRERGQVDVGDAGIGSGLNGMNTLLSTVRFVRF